MSHVLVRDIETRSTVDLSDVGVHVYAAHPSTEVLCVGFCVDDGPLSIWHPGDPVPLVFKEAANGSGWAVVAHNAAFEIEIERSILGPRHNFPTIPIERQVCTMAQVLALSLPGALEKAAKVLNLANQKDLTGARLMKQLAKPRRARKTEDKNSVYYFDDAERMAMLDRYCMQDVATTREIYQRLPPLSEGPHVWQLDYHINDRGFFLDRELAEAAEKIAATAHPIINAELTKITNGEVTAYTQVARLTAWLQQHIDVSTLGKDAINELLNKKELTENVRRALVLRLLGAQAAVAKAGALLDRRGADGRVRGSFVYHAAGPGRWSSRGAQVHNLKRPLTEDIERAVEIISTGDFKHACKHYDNPLSVIGDCIRAMIVAAPGHTLIGGDFSGIEARVTAWIAGEESKLDVFRAFDAGTGPDPYIVAAAMIFGVDADELNKRYKAGDPQARELRQVGKACELAFGYQGGVNAFYRFTPSGGNAMTASQMQWEQGTGSVTRGSLSGDQKKNQIETDNFSEDQVQKIKQAWRRAHPNIVRFWSSIDRAAWAAVRSPSKVVSVGNKLQLECDDQPFLWLTLPSGRKLAYPHARITRASIYHGKVVEHKHGQSELLFKDAASGRWHDVKVYGGLLTENIVQAISRDLLAEAMLRIDTAGYKIVTHVHDECVIEVPTKQLDSVKLQFTKLMMQLPEWAEGFPVAVNVWSGHRYAK